MRPSESVLRGADLPPRLADLPDPPQFLRLWGDMPRGPGVAIVGTRAPTPDGAAFAFSLAAELASAGVVVFSGGAKGIDSQAHRGALDAGGATVVVAPSGLDEPYPRENAELFERVVGRGGAYVTSFPSGTKAASPNFFARNAQLVALAHAVVVVEAGFQSGARNAAKQARRLRRQLFAVPGGPYNAKAVGCILELKLGARPLMGAKDVLDALASLNQHPVPVPLCERRPQLPREDRVTKPRSSDRAAALEPDARRLLELVAESPRHADQLCDRTGLAPSRVQQLVLELRMAGLVECDLTGRIAILDGRS